MDVLGGISSFFWQHEIAPWLETQKEQIIFYEGDNQGVVAIVRSSDPQNSGIVFEGKAFGHPKRVIELLESLDDEVLGKSEIMMNREVYENMPHDLCERCGAHWGHEWEFFFATQAVPSVAGDDAVVVIPTGSEEFLKRRAEILAVLQKANPISEAVDDIDRLDWFVIPGDDGKLACVMGASEHGGKIHFAGLATDPHYRGRGFASAVMVATVNYWLLQGKTIYFGMWAWNHKARKLYLRLGLTPGPRLIFCGPQPFEDFSQYAL
ncbi:GNAT superfamily N-acetyltransferase [Arcanobacterium pluranimalium]|uniref:GNAT family N-acetyltransferase n=1 Tax=Arcanobacterium pluranimalium TaxID=108028 RepID=UPI001957E176|nr:GNAT family N-acetyltransferase [Arcanobacterium pluranimalium]MBM7825452.1 GNAT superfamily N-acetyltransferase [Arcanobacterium pluranimalium]